MKINHILGIGCALLSVIVASPGDEHHGVPDEFITGARVTKPILADLFETVAQNARVKPSSPRDPVDHANKWMRPYIRANKLHKEKMRNTLATHVSALVKAAETEDALPCGGTRIEAPIAGSRKAKSMRARARTLGSVDELHTEPTLMPLTEALRARGISKNDAHRNAARLLRNLEHCRTEKQRTTVRDEIRTIISTSSAAAVAEEALIPGASPCTSAREKKTKGRTCDGRDGTSHVGSVSTGHHRGKSRRR